MGVWITMGLLCLGLGAYLGRRALIRRAFGGYRHALHAVDDTKPPRAAPGVAAPRVAVIGAGLAGLGAACDLSERGLKVTLFDQNPYLGGKLGAWCEESADGEVVEVEHGFHAFFRHYYNLNGWLERTGIRNHLTAADDYVILDREGAQWRFGEVEPTPVLNLWDLSRRGLYCIGDVLRTRAKHELDVFLAYDHEPVFAELDAVSYREFAERAELPGRLRLVFNTFSRAFFASDDRLSAAELVKSFHFYYLSHDHGLLFDYPADDYQQSVLAPVQQYLTARGVELRLGEAIDRIEPLAAHGAGRWNVQGASFDHLVLATPARAASALVERSAQGLGEAGQGLRAQLATLKPGQRYAVWRVWLDRDIRQGLPVFVSTERQPSLDALSLVHRITGQARRWARQHGGSVLELHCYAMPDGMDSEQLQHCLMQELHHYFPELAGANVVRGVLQLRDDFTAFHVGQNATRPRTGTDLPGLWLAGDWVKLPCPAMLMEAAYTASLLATNGILAEHGLRGYPVWTVPRRGLLHAARKLKQRRASAG